MRRDKHLVRAQNDRPEVMQRNIIRADVGGAMLSPS
jgi:hypothetical protein